MTTLSRQPTHHGYAVNVKDHEVYNDRETGPLSEDEVQAVYDAEAENFWDLVQEVATDHGFKGAYSAGRSSGWCQPYPQPHNDEDLAEWVQKIFRPFERDVIGLMSACREGFELSLDEAVKAAEREPVERAYWESRDVCTVDA